MFKIGDFSRLVQISVRMLRYYDEMDVLHPAHIDEKSGYRYYSVEQIERVRRITVLRDLDFKVGQMKEILDHFHEPLMKKMLLQRKKELEKEIDITQQRIQRIEDILEDVELKIPFIVRTIPSYTILSYRKRLKSNFDEHMLWDSLSAYVKEHHLEKNLLGGNVAIYHDEEYREEGSDVEVGFYVEQALEDDGDFHYRSLESVEEMACILVWGTYDKLADGYVTLAHWLGKHPSYKIAGYSRQVCHLGAWNEDNPQRWLTEIQIPVHR